MLGLGKWWMHLRRWRLERVHAAHRRANAKGYAGIHAILAAFHSSGGLRHGYQAYKLFSLRELLRDARPKRILELGSGTTTAVLAEYIRSCPGSSMVSVDESEGWLANSAQLAGICENDRRFRMIASPRRVSTMADGQLAVGYGVALDVDFDFVLVDGPSLTIDGVKHKDAVNSDIFALSERIAPRLIAVDGRRATVEAFRAFSSGRHSAEPSEVFDHGRLRVLLPGGPMRPGYRYFSTFRRLR